jgi:hypothetical protein
MALSLEPLDKERFWTGVELISATLQEHGFPDCTEAAPQCDAATCSCPMQQAHACDFKG